MNAAHLHLLFTHLPIIGLVIAILLNLYAVFNKSTEILKLSLMAYLVLSVFVLLAYMTGDGASEIIKTYPGIPADVIENHENIAFMFLISQLVISCLAGVGLYMSKTKPVLLKKFNVYLLVVALLLSILAVKTGTSGAEIRHPEIQQGIISDKEVH